MKTISIIVLSMFSAGFLANSQLLNQGGQLQSKTQSLTKDQIIPDLIKPSSHRSKQQVIQQLGSAKSQPLILAQSKVNPREWLKRRLEKSGKPRLDQDKTKIEKDSNALLRRKISTSDIVPLALKVHKLADEGGDNNNTTMSFPRPLVLSAGTIRSGKTTIRLAGIKETTIDRQCGSGEETWPCGNFAKAALQRFILARTLTCKTAGQARNIPIKSPKKIGSAAMARTKGNLIADCHLRNQNIGQWLVSQGWAEASYPRFEVLMEEAKAEGRGIWR